MSVELVTGGVVGGSGTTEMTGERLPTDWYCILYVSNIKEDHRNPRLISVSHFSDTDTNGGCVLDIQGGQWSLSPGQ